MEDISTNSSQWANSEKQPSFPLTELPLEIQFNVLRQCIVAPVPTVKSTIPGYIPLFGEAGAPGILRTCKIYATEGLRIAYALNTFCYSAYFDNSLLSQLPFFHRYIENLRLRHVYKTANPFSVAQGCAYMVGWLFRNAWQHETKELHYSSIKNPFPRLRNLQIDFHISGSDTPQPLKFDDWFTNMRTKSNRKWLACCTTQELNNCVQDVCERRPLLLEEIILTGLPHEDACGILFEMVPLVKPSGRMSAFEIEGGKAIVALSTKDIPAWIIEDRKRPDRTHVYWTLAVDGIVPT